MQGALGEETPCVGIWGAFCAFRSLSYESDSLENKGRLEMSRRFRALVTFESQHPQRGLEPTLTLVPRFQTFLSKTCVYVCVHALVCVHVWCLCTSHVHVQVHARMYVFVCMCTHVCKCALCVCAHVHQSVHVHAHACIHNLA